MTNEHVVDGAKKVTVVMTNEKEIVCAVQKQTSTENIVLAILLFV